MCGRVASNAKGACGEKVADFLLSFSDQNLEAQGNRDPYAARSRSGVPLNLTLILKPEAILTE